MLLAGISKKSKYQQLQIYRSLQVHLTKLEYHESFLFFNLFNNFRKWNSYCINSLHITIHTVFAVRSTYHDGGANSRFFSIDCTVVGHWRVFLCQWFQKQLAAVSLEPWPVLKYFLAFIKFLKILALGH